MRVNSLEMERFVGFYLCFGLSDVWWGVDGFEGVVLVL